MTSPPNVSPPEIPAEEELEFNLRRAAKKIRRAKVSFIHFRWRNSLNGKETPSDVKKYTYADILMLMLKSILLLTWRQSLLLLVRGSVWTRVCTSTEPTWTSWIRTPLQRISVWTYQPCPTSICSRLNPIWHGDFTANAGECTIRLWYVFL